MNNPRQFMGNGITKQLELIPVNFDHSIKPNWPWLRKARGKWTVRCVDKEGKDVIICSCDNEQEACNIVIVLRRQMQDIEKLIIKNRRLLHKLNKQNHD